MPEEQAREALLPDTDALTRSTVEFSHRREKILVRYRNAQGYVTREEFEDREAANMFFWSCVRTLNAEVKEAHARRTR